MRDLDLVLLHMPRGPRALVADLFALDAALGEVIRTTREPMVGRIRLAWWRERLQEMDQEIVPGAPHLQGAARIVEASGLTGGMLAEELVDRWELLREPFPWEEQVVGAVAGRGAALFGHSALMLGAEPTASHPVMTAGALWALVDVAKHCSDEDSRFVLVDVARDEAEKLAGQIVAPAARPLTMLGLLAQRDLDRWPEVEPEATPGRAWLMIAHKLTGKL